MKNILKTTLVAVFLTGCAAEKQTEPELKDLNIFLTSGPGIDSVFISNISQDKLFKFLPYNDTLLIDANTTLNDLYNINFFSGENRRMNQFWLNGDNITIRGRVNDKLELEVDTVIGSDLYYKSIAFRSKYKAIVVKNDTAAINTFLLKNFEENLNNPFSIEIANNFFLRNVSEKKELRKLYELQVKQDSAIINHLINPFKRIEKILLETSNNFSTFDFYDKEKNLTKLDLPPGKKYLIDFWFINCPPCVEDHKILASKIPSLKNRNIEVIGISTDKDHEKWKQYVTDKDYTWRNYREIDDYKRTAANEMLINVFPTYLLIDEKGEIADRTFSFNDIVKHLDLK